MALVTFDPFDEMRALQKQFFGSDWFPARRLHTQLAATDIYTQDDKQMVIEAHLPNFNQKDVEVNVDRSVLTIRAEKHEKEEDKGKQYMLRESSSSFFRRVRLPDQANEGKINAEFKNGVLKVTVPFKALPKPKKVQIAEGNK